MSAPTMDPKAAQPNDPSTSPAAPSASLYIGELDPSVTEAMLFEMFNMIGPVASIRVCRDAVTRRSLGYAYVNFHNVVDGERALESLNYTLVKGKPCRIMWSQRDPAMRKTGSGNIFIKNLDVTIDNKALHDTFSAFGNILSCKIAIDESGNSKGYGFVHYETDEAAENAIKHVNGMLLNDKKVFVGAHVPKKERQAKMEEKRAKFTNVFVKNIDPEMDDKTFEALFTAYGRVTSALISKDEEGKSKGFGFVNFENYEDAHKAVNELNEEEINGKLLYVGRAQKKEEREAELRKQYEQAKLEKLAKYQGVNLYVKNLDDDVDDEKLRTEFSVYGVITSVKIMRDDKNTSKGFGFVCFSSPDEATKAVTEMNGRMVGSKPIYVALAQRKEARRAQLEAHIAQQRRIHPPYVPPFPGQHPMGGFPLHQQQQQQRPYAPRMPPQPRRALRSMPVSESVPKAQEVGKPMLDGQPPEMQKQMLGERLYPLIHAQQPEYSGKITGMLLEMDNTELLKLLEEQAKLDEKIVEAMTVLEASKEAK